ncbi:hypothetical protein MPDQ_001816 [Monascus purpureus]|uniref:Transcription factor domain-containing protein n=1 Tax=Monascus purpureus TaxID=5098 RepID=A0A507QLW3_MONPU|nr:hypothetical protein MPDQ_001816 [Monascus purpureus]
MLTNHRVNFDEWEGDMKSRVFWNCLMVETILVQELHLPPSGLLRLEELVPIPKFIGFETAGFVPAKFPSLCDELDDSYFQYHFLAQVAHRIILTRIRHSLYFFSVADAMLRGRYKIAKFHIGRPYIYKALRTPSALTEYDLEQVKSGLRNAMDWPIIQGVFRKMKSCIPIKFAFCSQIRDTLPLGWERWNDEMLLFIEECAPYSPAIAKDLELLQLLLV